MKVFKKIGIFENWAFDQWCDSLIDDGSYPGVQEYFTWFKETFNVEILSSRDSVITSFAITDDEEVTEFLLKYGSKL
jgi:hypothetical protein